MSNTIASLLEKLKIYHEIDQNSPLLHLPLSLFKEEEYTDLITITLLYGDGWIKPEKAPKPQTVMGEISLGHVQQFYSAIKFKVSTALDNSIMSNAIPGSEVDPLSVSRSPWVNPTQVTHFFRNNPVYKVLMSCLQCPEELTFFFKWFEGEKISPSDKDIYTKHLKNLKSNEAWKTSVDNLVAVLTQLSHPYPQRMTYEFLIKINQQLENLDKNNFSPEILSYYQEVLTLLASKFPTTLESLCTSIGILIPTHLEGHLASILRHDLTKIPGLTAKEWPQLLYYAALLMFQQAEAHPSILSFTYSGKELPEALKSLVEQHAQHFEPFLQTPEQCKKAVDLDFCDIISNELQEKGFNVHPMLLTLLGFEQCDAFRNLMGTALSKQGETDLLTCRTVALKPSTNRFLLGEALSRGNIVTSTHLLISNHDLSLIEQLIELARDKKETTSLTPPSAIDVQTKTTPQQQPTPMSNIPSLFLSLPPLKIPVMDKCESQFNVIKSQIKDPILRNNLSISTMNEFSYVPVINHQAILSFIFDFEINSANRSNPSLEELHEFFDVIGDNDSLNLIFEELIHSQLFINLEDDVDSLNIQVEKLGASVGKLDAILSSFTEPPKEEDLNLRYRWLNIQKRFCLRFKELLEEKIESVETIQLSEEGYAINSRMLGFLP